MTTVDELLTVSSLLSDWPIPRTGTRGVRAIAVPDAARRSHARGPRKPSCKLAFASAAALGAISRRRPQSATRMRDAESAPMPTSQIGGSAMSQRFAKSGVIMCGININDMEKKQSKWSRNLRAPSTSLLLHRYQFLERWAVRWPAGLIFSG